jgi:hypothetical protein
LEPSRHTFTLTVLRGAEVVRPLVLDRAQSSQFQTPRSRLNFILEC